MDLFERDRLGLIPPRKYYFLIVIHFNSLVNLFYLAVHGDWDSDDPELYADEPSSSGNISVTNRSGEYFFGLDLVYIESNGT